jgi:fructokinase
MGDEMGKDNGFVMVGIGELLWDMLPQGRQLGGAPANFACHATRLGSHGVVVSAVGNDANGAELLDVLREKGVDCRVATSGYPTGTVEITMDEGGVPSYTIHENVAWDHIQLQESDVALAERADVLCYGSLAHRNRDSADSIRRYISSTSAQCIRLFDINLRQNYYSSRIVDTLLERSTVVKLNDEELVVVADFLGLSGCETRLLDQILERYKLDLIILTKGEFGSRLFSRDHGDSIRQGRAVEVVDTVGAGDAFGAAVATGLCHDMALETIHLFASNVAAYVCSHAGATPPLPPLPELMVDR